MSGIVYLTNSYRHDNQKNIKFIENENLMDIPEDDDEEEEMQVMFVAPRPGSTKRKKRKGSLFHWNNSNVHILSIGTGIFLSILFFSLGVIHKPRGQDS